MNSRLKRSYVTLTVLLIGLSLPAFASNALWVAAPGAKAAESAVSHYRLRFSLDTVPESYVVQVSADAVYHLYVNGVRVVSGPPIGDPAHWRYDTVELAAHLVPGENVLAAVVWSPVGNWAAPVSFMGQSTGFSLNGVTDPSISTGRGKWTSIASSAYRPLKKPRLHAFYALGSFEQFTAQQHPWGWEQPQFDDSAWEEAVQGALNHKLVPSRIPRPEYQTERLSRVRDAVGVEVDAAFLNGKAPITIPANKTVTLLFDHNELINAYPALHFSGGEGASIEMGYAESLFEDPKKKKKGDRDQVQGKQWLGAYDLVIADGGDQRIYRPLWFRTFRYLRLQIKTADRPLTLTDLSCESVGYPFKKTAAFDARNEELDQIWNVGWRTLRLCAVDMFYDCPYYERLQYVGDTRIEALVSVYMSGDDRLMRKAISLYNDSLGEGGLTTSRYPSNIRQLIPPFSNWWIAMVDDYRQLNGDQDFIKEMVPAIKAVISRFKDFTHDSGLITFSALDEWDFVDWSGHLSHGKERKSDVRTPSGLLSLNHAYALDRAVEIMRYVGDEEAALEYEVLSRNLKNAVYAQCWDADKGVLSDDPRMTRYTEHANLLGILTDTIPQEDQQNVMRRILDKTVDLTPATIYFRFYYTRALVKTGLADQYLDTLSPWRDQLKLNLTTWAEKPEPSRSDCHAWGSSPNYEFLAAVAGIMPASSGFSTVRIAPALGNLESVDAHMPHPKGIIDVKLRKVEQGLTAQVRLPDQVSGTFEWGGKKISLHPGEQTLSIDAPKRK